MGTPWPQHWKSRRLAGYNYSTPGEYFVTICTRDRACVFGEIVERAMRLSREGQIAEQAWRDLPRYHSTVEVDEFVIMPNHVHGILILRAGSPLLATIVGGFKSEVSRLIGRPVWQRSYFDHVITTKRGLDLIRRYIGSNPEENPRGGQARLLPIHAPQD